MHKAVLLQEVIEILEPKPGEFFIDCTVGEGGHSRAILNRLLPLGMMLFIDWDKDILTRTKEAIEQEFRAGRDNFKMIWLAANYAELLEILREYSLPKADGVLIDLGISSYHLEESGKGFSFLKDEPLIMTYSDEAVPVRNIIRQLDFNPLARIIRDYGEEKYAERIAKKIKERAKDIYTSKELAEAIAAALPQQYERGRIHPATRSFQALRIYANRELENLEKVLSDLPLILNSGGRVAIISFHSLEDRLVKNYFKRWEKEGVLNILTKKPIQPSREEIENNLRSRSAKLRAAIRT